MDRESLLSDGQWELIEPLPGSAAGHRAADAGERDKLGEAKDTAGPPATSARPHRPVTRSPKPDDHQRRDGGSGLSMSANARLSAPEAAKSATTTT